MSRQTFEDALASIQRPARSIEASLKATNLQLSQQISTTSTLGTTIDKSVKGFKSLAVTLDDLDSDDMPFQSLKNIPIAQLKDDLTEVATTLQKTVTPEIQTKLTSLTGLATDLSKDFNRVVVSAGYPQALAASVADILPQTALNDLKSIAKKGIDTDLLQISDTMKPVLMSSISDIKEMTKGFDSLLSDAVSDTVQSIKGLKPLGSAFSKLKASVSSISSQIVLPPSLGFKATIDNLVEANFQPAENIIRAVAIKNGILSDVPDKFREQIISLKGEGKTVAASNILKKFSDLPLNELKEAVEKIDNRLSVALKTSASVQTVAKDLNNVNRLWPGNTAEVPDAYWTTNTIPLAVGGANLLKSELTAMEREVTEVLIGATGTGTDVALTANDLNDMTRTKMQVNSNYHYVITRSGQLQRLRPLKEEAIANQYLPNDHHLRSIHVCLIGGMIGPQRKTDRSFGPRGYTIAQRGALDKLLETILIVFPGMQILGMNDIGSSLAPAPFFDVTSYAASKLRVKPILDDPLIEPPLLIKEITESGVA